MPKEDKQKEIHGLAKLDDKSYIKALENELSSINIERGKDTSYIQELEDRISSLNEHIMNDISKEAKKLILAPFKKKIKKQNDSFLQLKKTYSELMNKYINIKNQNHGTN